MAKSSIVFEKLTVEDQEKVRAGETLPSAPTVDLCIPRPNPATCHNA
ncbi:MAG: hypothetical protein JSV88_26810 [Candidatus Aminicenantes bacterium]|nr:MAG: hypothetical protein JSV88_26810 [Candidatus Aminicenantes bacterium]